MKKEVGIRYLKIVGGVYVFLGVSVFIFPMAAAIGLFFAVTPYTFITSLLNDSWNHGIPSAAYLIALVAIISGLLSVKAAVWIEKDRIEGKIIWFALVILAVLTTVLDALQSFTTTRANVDMYPNVITNIMWTVLYVVFLLIATKKEDNNTPTNTSTSGHF